MFYMPPGGAGGAWPGRRSADDPMGQPPPPRLPCTDWAPELSGSSGDICPFVASSWGQCGARWGLDGQGPMGPGWPVRQRRGGGGAGASVPGRVHPAGRALPSADRRRFGFIETPQPARPAGPGPTALRRFVPRKEGEETQNCPARSAKSQEYLHEIIPIFWKRLGSSHATLGPKGLGWGRTRSPPHPASRQPGH